MRSAAAFLAAPLSKSTIADHSPWTIRFLQFNKITLPAGMRQEEIEPQTVKYFNGDIKNS
jgi:hypothetical protein